MAVQFVSLRCCRSFYPTDKDTTADVKIWEIRYSSDIKENLKYLEIESAD